jgi:nesprin-1
MDWNVSPDDERQFDEYFKDERPSSATSDSSTSTDTTHLESILGEPVEDPEASISQVTDMSDSSRGTPTPETVSSEVETVEEKEGSCQVAIGTQQEFGDKTISKETVELPETKDNKSKDEVGEITPIPSAAEEETSQQIPEPIDVTVISKDIETETLVDSEEKMPIELAKQLSQQLVEEVLKAVESHPALERMSNENVIQTSPTDPSSSSDNEQESSSSEDESGWWVVGSPEKKEKKTTEEPFEIVEKDEVTDLALNETVQQLDDFIPSTTPENQLAKTVEELIVPLDSDRLQETISKSIKTETSTNVTVIRVGYEPSNESQQLIESPSIESVIEDIEIPIEMPQVAETPSSEPTTDDKTDTMDEEQFVSVDAEKTVLEMGEKIVEVLPGIVEQLSNIETLIEDNEKDVGAVERSQSQEEESTKEKGDEWNMLTEHRQLVAPTLGENTTGPPIDDSQIMEKVARLVSDRVAMSQEEAQQLELNTEWQEIQDLLVNRLSDQLRQGANSSTHTSSVRYLATVTQVTVDESVEERKVKLNDNLAALKTAVQRKEVVVIQRIVITIVRTVTEWLETIEYRVYTIKQTKSMERRTEQIQSLCEEVRVVEESLNTLEEITEMAVEVVNEETKVLLNKCVKSLKQQMQSVSEVTKRSEGEIEHIRRQWADYLDQISSEEDRIKDLMSQLKQLQSTETLPSQEKLVQLEDIETAVQERLEGVTQLLHSGHNLVKETPFYQMPESAYALMDTIKIIEEAVRDERNVVLHKAALTAEYRQTLQEFAEIVRLSEALSDSKLAARNPPEASQELEKRQRFLFCLSHFLQVLDTLEPHLDLDTRSLCQDLHAELVVHAGTILDRAVNRQEIVEMTLASWNHLELQWNQEDEWFRQLQIPDTSNVISEAFTELTESLKVLQENSLHFFLGGRIGVN